MYLYPESEYLGCMDTDFPAGTRSAFARAISAEVRAVMAARRITLREFAAGAGFASHNYLAIRLRDEKPFTLDDIELVCAYLEEDAPTFIGEAYDHHFDRLWMEARDGQADRRVADPTAGSGAFLTKAADHTSQEDEAASAVDRLDRRARDTRPTRKRAMQQLDDQAARGEDTGA